MSLILNIDTALSNASVCLSRDKQSIAFAQNNNQQGHASWLHTTIDEMMKNASCTIKQLDAVAVVIGPGSYTGLRVGLSSAKGFCYAANIPLITISSTELLAFTVKEEAEDLICPVIDARRMEVFTAVYDKNLIEITAPHSLILEKNSYSEYLKNHSILFCGNACKKLQDFYTNDKMSYSSSIPDATHLAIIAMHRFNSKLFADLAYAEPLYVKEFYSPDRKQ